MEIFWKLWYHLNLHHLGNFLSAKFGSFDGILCRITRKSFFHLFSNSGSCMSLNFMKNWQFWVSIVFFLRIAVAPNIPKKFTYVHISSINDHALLHNFRNQSAPKKNLWKFQYVVKDIETSSCHPVENSWSFSMKIYFPKSCFFSFIFFRALISSKNSEKIYRSVYFNRK